MVAQLRGAKFVEVQWGVLSPAQDGSSVDIACEALNDVAAEMGFFDEGEAYCMELGKVGRAIFDRPEWKA